MQLLDRIEKRRFVGREFLLFLWFESELLEATLPLPSTVPGGDGGTFGLWIERQLVLSAGKEVTRIKGGLPASGREAKEALLLGKLPEAAGIHVSWRDREISLTLKAERMALSGLVLPVVLGNIDDSPPVVLEQRRPPKKGRRTTPDEDRERAKDEQHESFYERMLLTREVESLLEGLYRDFLRLRLGAAWEEVVRPALALWVAGGDAVDADRYVAEKRRALSLRPPSRKAEGRRPKR